MNNEDFVYVISASSGRVGLTMPSLKFKKVWPKKRTRLPVPKDVLREGIFDPGIAALFKKGILYIEDVEFKREIGLEPYDEEETIIFLEDKMMDRLLGAMPLTEFKKELKKLTVRQVEELAEYAVAHDLINMDKAAVIKQICNRDILRAYQLKKQNEEVLPDEDGNDSLRKSI